MLLGSMMLALPLGGIAGDHPAPGGFVRIAELEVDPAQIERFQLAARAHVDATLAAEPGVSAFIVAAEKEQGHRVRVFERYADDRAYQAHLQSPHFLAFRAATEAITTSRTLHDTTPLLLGAKPRWTAAQPMVRVAEIAIDPAQLDAYRAAVSEEIEASIRIEPGVLAIYAVALRDEPAQLRFFEIYADDAAYRQHIASPHFRRYVATTASMITARRLLEAEPIALGLQAR